MLYSDWSSVTLQGTVLHKLTGPPVIIREQTNILSGK